MTQPNVAKIREEYMDRVYNDMPAIQSAINRTRLCLENKRYGEAFNAIVTAQTIANFLGGDFPISHLMKPNKLSYKS